MSYINYGFLFVFLIPFLLIIWSIQIIYKLIDKKVHFDKDGGIYIRLKFDYYLLFYALIIAAFCMAIASFKERIGFAVVTIILLLILFIAKVLYNISNETFEKDWLKSLNTLKLTNAKMIFSIVISIDLVMLEIVSYVFWNALGN